MHSFLFIYFCFIRLSEALSDIFYASCPESLSSPKILLNLLPSFSNSSKYSFLKIIWLITGSLSYPWSFFRKLEGGMSRKIFAFLCYSLLSYWTKIASPSTLCLRSYFFFPLYPSFPFLFTVFMTLPFFYFLLFFNLFFFIKVAKSILKHYIFLQCVLMRLTNTKFYFFLPFRSSFI